MRTILTAALLAVAGTAQAYEAGDMLLRGAVTTVAPDASSSELVVDGAAVAGSEADVDDGTALGMPPTVSLQYFPADSGSAFQPYVGAGLNYTLFFDEDVDGQLEGVLGPGDLDLDASLGLALQAGFDYALNENWLLNVGIWWADIDTDATFTFEDGTRVTTDVEIDPWVYSLSVGYRF